MMRALLMDANDGRPGTDGGREEWSGSPFSFVVLEARLGFGHPRHCGLGDDETTLNASHPKAIARPRPSSQPCVTVESMCLA